MFDGGHLTAMGMEDGLVDDLLIILIIVIGAGEYLGELSNDVTTTVATFTKELILGVLLHWTLQDQS